MKYDVATKRQYMDVLSKSKGDWVMMANCVLSENVVLSANGYKWEFMRTARKQKTELSSRYTRIYDQSEN